MRVTTHSDQSRTDIPPLDKMLPQVFATGAVTVRERWGINLHTMCLSMSVKLLYPENQVLRETCLPDMDFTVFTNRMEDGIVLSPQRQSFGQGCQIPQTAPERGSQQDRIKSMITRTDVRERDGRSRLTGRVGRGRTLDYKERTPLRERNKASCLDVLPRIPVNIYNTQVKLLLNFKCPIRGCFQKKKKTEAHDHSHFLTESCSQVDRTSQPEAADGFGLSNGSRFLVW